MRTVAMMVVVALGGCGARFLDERPLSERPDLLPPPPPDLRVEPPDLTVLDLAAPDGSVGDLATAPPPDLAPALKRGVFARGTFEGRAGHGGRGGAALFRRDDGSIELQLANDFGVTGVVGPVVVLASRDALGTRIDAGAGDLDLGALARNSGEQNHAVPGGDGGRRWAWIFCRPFGVEVARARLEEVP